MFTKFCHHYSLFTVFIMQNVLAEGKCAQTITLNMHILALFDKRDRAHIHTPLIQVCQSWLRAFPKACNAIHIEGK